MHLKLYHDRAPPLIASLPADRPPWHQGAQDSPALAPAVVGGLAARGVEIDLEAENAPGRWDQPLANAPVARPADRHPEAQVRRACKAAAEQPDPFARLGQRPRAASNPDPARGRAVAVPPTDARHRSMRTRQQPAGIRRLSSLT